MPVWLLFLMPVYMNIPALVWWFGERGGIAVSPMASVLLWFVLGVFGVVWLLWLHVFPFWERCAPSVRMTIMMGGRRLVRIGFWALLAGAASLWAVWAYLPWGYALADTIWLAVFVGLLFLNGTLRMLFTSRRLSILYRVSILMLWWVPLVNLLVLKKCCRLCWEEYDFALYKAALHSLRVESDACATRYPLVMVHGVLFRDLRWFNYWGRIPGELMRLGAHVYYGNQEAVGTVARNAADLRARVLSIVETTGCGKVNIIAHSKGGLDARYAITALGLAPYVATLTTMSTPHRGVRFVDGACKLPEGLYRGIGRIFDATFRRMGDKEPDFYAATRQFATGASAQFNTEVPDVPGVYYQSYTTVMRSMLSDSLLCVPYCLVKAGEGANDGLVSVESAKWGEFRGVITAPGRRGISHGDIIDLKREDIKGFDVCEAYVGIVAELKQRGY